MLGTPTGGSWHRHAPAGGPLAAGAHDRLTGPPSGLGRSPHSSKLPRTARSVARRDARSGRVAQCATGPAGGGKAQASAAWRDEIEDFRPAFGRNLYIAGTAPATPSGMDDYTAEGDGQTTATRSAFRRQMRVWYIASDHGGLISQSDADRPAAEHRHWRGLDSQPHPPASGPDPRSAELAGRGGLLPRESRAAGCGVWSPGPGGGRVTMR